MISLRVSTMRNIAFIQAPRNISSGDFSNDDFFSRLESLQKRIGNLEGNRSSDFYKYAFGGIATVVAAIFGGGYINKRIDDTKSELKEKIGDAEKHLNEKIDEMGKNIIAQINLSHRVLILEGESSKKK